MTIRRDVTLCGVSFFVHKFFSYPLIYTNQHESISVRFVFIRGQKTNALFHELCIEKIFTFAFETLNSDPDSDPDSDSDSDPDSDPDL